MIHNDVLRSVRYMLNITDGKIAEIAKLPEGFELSKTDVIAYMKIEGEEGYLQCSDEVMAHFLDGLVIHKRGRDKTRPPQQVTWPITNNIVLKKLRVAFELKEDDIHEILNLAGFKVSNPEVSALFRKEGHKHYRHCGDQFLRNFLKGLTQRIRPTK
ncbi:DUF1456 family protein [Chitinimonas arctica]|uniref:DUF1456 family protein n=1 Tax=Chitinimonas arctica TaxID=2594795 RepID=A0A516SHZ1_9NEIS|nr:DUF1456 family protein [Chitinimonas arctica]QDQ27781.1 DUF1456 family protein [Chitinimonas arctica]